MLPSSLEKLGKDFKCDFNKSHFPYNFVNKRTLNYIGNKPRMDYYPNIKLDEYNKITKEN